MYASHFNKGHISLTKTIFSDHISKIFYATFKDDNSPHRKNISVYDS